MIEDEWIDKLFDCMDKWYGERWNRQFTEPKSKVFSDYRIRYYKSVWKNGLRGLSYFEIRDALKLYKRAALDPKTFPPTCMEFFRNAKSKTSPTFDYNSKQREVTDSTIAKEALSDIKKKLGCSFSTN